MRKSCLIRKLSRNLLGSNNPTLRHPYILGYFRDLMEGGVKRSHIHL